MSLISKFRAEFLVGQDYDYFQNKTFALSIYRTLDIDSSRRKNKSLAGISTTFDVPLVLCLDKGRAYETT